MRLHLKEHRQQCSGELRESFVDVYNPSRNTSEVLHDVLVLVCNILYGGLDEIYSQRFWKRMDKVRG